MQLVFPHHSPWCIILLPQSHMVMHHIKELFLWYCPSVSMGQESGELHGFVEYLVLFRRPVPGFILGLPLTKVCKWQLTVLVRIHGNSLSFYCNRISPTPSHPCGLTISVTMYIMSMVLYLALLQGLVACLIIPCLFYCISLTIKPSFFHLQTCWLFLPLKYNLVCLYPF